VRWWTLLTMRRRSAGRAANRIALRSSVGIVSPEASGARQAVALLTHSMREVSSPYPYPSSVPRTTTPVFLWPLRLAGKALLCSTHAPQGWPLRL